MSHDTGPDPPTSVAALIDPLESVSLSLSPHLSSSIPPPIAGSGSAALSLSTNASVLASTALATTPPLSLEGLPAPDPLNAENLAATTTLLAPPTTTSTIGTAGANTATSSEAGTPGDSRAVTPSTTLAPPPSASANTSPVGLTVPTKAKDGKEKKSVFGKLFDRTSSSTSSAGAGAGGEKMERGDSGVGSGANTPGGGSGLLSRRSSKKEKEEKPPKEAKSSEGRPRAESNGYLSSGGKSEGMGAALNEFMRNKVSRKSSQTSNKGRSEDGRSSVGDGNTSAYGGSTTAGDAKSRASGGAGTSLLKKYGVCEKVAIGKGATAVVKLAHKWDRTTERLYAVKEFRKRRKNETEKEYVKKLTSEFCISSTLHHHNIVETVDLVQDEQSHWCEVMEYCPGGDLYAAIKKGNMSSPSINSYFKQILSGVSYLHSMGVAHRDIKPENLLLDAKGHIKITDFGVSDVFRMCWEKTTHLSKGLCGSEPYIAPEQFDQKEYDARLVDVWACAVVFYCMHFQELPWRVAKASDSCFGPYLHQYSQTASPAPLSNLVPRECRSIIKRMLDPNPATRATTEEVLLDPWFESIVVIPPLEFGPTPNFV